TDPSAQTVANQAVICRASRDGQIERAVLEHSNPRSTGPPARHRFNEATSDLWRIEHAAIEQNRIGSRQRLRITFAKGRVRSRRVLPQESDQVPSHRWILRVGKADFLKRHPVAALRNLLRPDHRKETIEDNLLGLGPRKLDRPRALE